MPILLLPTNIDERFFEIFLVAIYDAEVIGIGISTHFTTARANMVAMDGWSEWKHYLVNVSAKNGISASFKRCAQSFSRQKPHALLKGLILGVLGTSTVLLVHFANGEDSGNLH